MLGFLLRVCAPVNVEPLVQLQDIFSVDSHRNVGVDRHVAADTNIAMCEGAWSMKKAAGKSREVACQIHENSKVEGRGFAQDGFFHGTSQNS